MGELKSQDPVISTTEPVKKDRGNPNLKRGEKNPYYEKTNKETNMADEAEVISETKTTSTPSSNDMSGEKKVIPDDIFSDVIPEKEILPLDGQAVDKTYATLADPVNQTKVNGSGNGGGGGMNKPPVTPSAGDLGGGGSTNPPLGDPTQNPGMGTGSPIEGAKTPEQVKTEAEQFVKLLLRGYDKLHAVGRWAGKMDPNDLALLHQKGKINLDNELALGTGRISLRSFFAEYNAQIEEDIVVSPDFVKDITPPLERIAIKRGWGLGDEGTVGLLLAEDLGTKVAILWGLKKTCTMILESQIQIMKNQQDIVEAKKKKAENPKETAKDFEADANSWREADGNIEDATEVK